MADISSFDEAVACEIAGADCISTTLNGYTKDSIQQNMDGPNFTLVKNLVAKLKIPIFAEGRIMTPKQAKTMIDIGTHGVVVGTIITRPRVITKLFVDSLK